MKTATSQQRVVITGMGIVSPLGNDVETLWKAILAGESGVGKTTIFDASTFPTTFDAEVKNYDFRRYTRYPESHEGCSRGSGFALGAAAQACRQAGISVETPQPADGIDRTRMGIYLGAGEGSLDNDAFFSSIIAGWDSGQQHMVWEKATEVVTTKMRAVHELEQEPNMATAHIAALSGARGPVRSCLTACAASTQAVGEAMMLIRKGDADVMIAGGAHSMIHPLGLTGFNRLTALSTRNDSPQTASRPFCLAELVGYGSSSDAFRVTDMHEEGRGAVQAMQAALADAGLTYKDIDCINTHGTSTQENDHVETLAIKTVFRERAKDVPASSVKSMLGHLIGAAGGAELITCVLAIRDNIVPPTTNMVDRDPKLDLDYVPNEPRKMPVNIVMNESFGFGGQNNVVIVKRFADE